MSEEREVGAGRREELEKIIAKILHRHCNFGWANYYIPSEKFPSLIQELGELLSPGGQVAHEELVRFFLGARHVESVQDKVQKLQRDYAVYRRG
ncbi:MAG TPA: hypothetical protein VNF29_01380 [Candidatus Binataceae bacterium]|nr:hypothetical protein [Candidatus Binataceae bacterium]